MDIRKLEIFEHVARLQSFSAAARQLHMAQPAVSIAIQKLEAQLGVQLFHRTSRKAQLTSDGQQALVLAKDVLTAMAGFSGQMQALQNLDTGELTIACPSMLATYYLPDLLLPFLNRYPGVKASVIQEGTGRIEQMLLAEEVELGVVTRSEAVLDKLTFTPLVSEQLVVCVPHAHPWAKLGNISVTTLAQQPMALYKSDYYIRQQLDQLCETHNVQLEIRLETNFLPLIFEMLRQGLANTVGLQMMANKQAEISAVPLHPQVIFEMGIATKKGRSISLANQAFLDWLS